MKRLTFLITVLLLTTVCWAQPEMMPRRVQVALSQVPHAGDYHRPIKGGTYEVTYSSRGYYSQTHTITVADGEAVVKDVQLAPINTGLEEFRFFDIYPNPTSGLLFVKASGIIEYRITNLLGQTLLTGVLNGETIDISVLSNGFYLLKIKNSIIKIIVNH